VGLNDLTGLPPQRVGVLLVDFQNQFCHPRACGPRPVTNAANAATARRANAFAAQAGQRGMQVIYTCQVLDPKRLTARQRYWDDQSGRRWLRRSWRRSWRRPAARSRPHAPSAAACLCGGHLVPIRRYREMSARLEALNLTCQNLPPARALGGYAGRPAQEPVLVLVPYDADKIRLGVVLSGPGRIALRTRN
jgi:hypothetical protein